MRWGTELKLEEALSYIFAESFDREDGSADIPEVRRVLYFGETIGTLVKHNVLDRALLRDLLWVDGVWRQVGAYALYARERAGEPALYENLEALATQPAS